jgi:hypothetical protein
MGISTSAHVFYGIPIHNPEDTSCGVDEMPEEMLEQLEKYPYHFENKGGVFQRTLSPAYDHPSRAYLAIKEIEADSWDGGVPFDPAQLTVTSEERQLLIDEAEKFGITGVEPQWFIGADIC